ncbi:MAG: FtsX-like permease family protein [Candidatus Promineifilaceae bacterium]
MNVRLQKILRDLTGNKGRTLLVVAAIAMGLVAISTTFRARVILTRNLERSLDEINQASGIILVPFADESVISAVSDLPSIADAEGREVVWARLRVGDEWRSLKIVGIADFDNMLVDRIASESGDWPPPPGSILIERSTLATTNAAVGDTVLIELPQGEQRQMPISGLAHDLNVVSGNLLDQVIFGYTSLDTIEQLGLPPAFNEIHFTTAENRLDESHIRQVMAEAQETVEARNVPVLGTRIPKPGKHLMDNVIQSLLLILGSLGLLSLFLSTFLVYNTIAAVLTRQIPQIGAMKAVGAPQGDIFKMYLATVFLFSLIAWLIAVPLGILGSRIMTIQLANLLNFNVERFAVPWYIFLLELVIGLVVPLLAALIPILNGTRRTVREAFSNQGPVAGDFGGGLIDRLFGRLPGLPASWSYAARNIFRRKLRLALTLVTLSLGGAIFITVLSVRQSLFLTINNVAAYWGQDVTVDLQQPYPLSELARITDAIPAVVRSEGWHVGPAFRLLPDGTASDAAITLFAIPIGSPFVEPTLLDGRWLQPDDTNAVVVNVDFAANEDDVEVGDTITLRTDGRESEWQVVGLVTTQMVGLGEPLPEIPMAYVPLARYAELNGDNALPNRLALETEQHDADSQEAAATQIDAALREEGILVRNVDTHQRTRDQAERLTSPILLLLISMAGLFAVVGGLSLAGTMSLNVLERTREIGIIRSIGAAGPDVTQIVIVEGIFVGLLSWLLAAVLAYPMGLIMSITVGISFIKSPLVYGFAPAGILLWLLVVVILSIVASIIPARGATKLVVREALAFE